MINPVCSILHRATNDRKLNILCAPTHERYETGLAMTGHNFYALRANGIKDWNTKYGAIPKNYTLLENGNVPGNISFDIILSQNKFGQYQVLKQLSQLMHVPLISLEHTLPVPGWNEATREAVKNMRGARNVFISSFSINQWRFDETDPTVRVIHHMVDTDTFTYNDGQRDNVLLSVVNDWINRDVFCGFKIWKRVTNKLPVRVLGDTPGLSKPASSIEELVSTYQKSSIFLNTSTVSPIPTALLEAMACGCACVSTATCMIPEIIEHGVDGFISNSEKELREYCELLLKDKDLASQIGINARKKILSRFNKEAFLNNWNTLFREVSKMVYTGV